MTKREYPEYPRVGVGAVVLREGRVLLVRRGVPPSQGLWHPGRRPRTGRDPAGGAEREILEETGITIRAGEQVFTGDLMERDANGRIRFHYVVIDFAADYVSGEVNGSDDASEAAGSPGGTSGSPATKTTLKLLRQLGFSPWPERRRAATAGRKQRDEKLPRLRKGSRPARSYREKGRMSALPGGVALLPELRTPRACRVQPVQGIAGGSGPGEGPGKLLRIFPFPGGRIAGRDQTRGIGTGYLELTVPEVMKFHNPLLMSGGQA